MRVLLIMPNFFNYPQVISEELERLGYTVDCFDDRPSTHGIIKAIIRINKKFIYHYIEKYFNSIMKIVNEKTYDVVLLISGQSLSFSEKMIEQLKKSQPNAKYVLYQWDSQKNFPYIKKVQKYFDKCYTFDKEDASDNENLEFLPLFYSRQYEEMAKKKVGKFKYDFCFVGTAHPKKYKFINEMSLQLKNVFPNQYIYFFFPSRIVYFYRKIRNKELRKAHYKEFHYIPLDASEMDEVMTQSRCVLDSAQAGQVGLTIRAIEALGAKKKLITTNPDILNYDFYREENVYVYNGEFDLEAPFFKERYKEIESQVYEKYSLRNWLQRLLNY